MYSPTSRHVFRGGANVVKYQRVWDTLLSPANVVGYNSPVDSPTSHLWLCALIISVWSLTSGGEGYSSIHADPGGAGCHQGEDGGLLASSARSRQLDHSGCRCTTCVCFTGHSQGQRVEIRPLWAYYYFLRSDHQDICSVIMLPPGYLSVVW